MNDLKPCPFCGSKARVELLANENGSILIKAACSSCCASTGDTLVFASRTEVVDTVSRINSAASDAIDFWNNRGEL